mmetsp:Transcript_92474/g.138510  ORF Transcript_92474/g.138510 Transcript_92474/m.138510 type:complete len:266 (-) Transcript_92474:1007-1804(-)
MLTVHAASTRIPHTPAHGTGHQHVLSESDSLHQTAQSPTASHTAASKPTCRAAARAWLSTSRTASRSRAAPAPSTNASHAHNGPATRYQPPAGGSVERSMPRKMMREAVAAGASSARTQASRGSRSRPVEVNRRTILAAHAPKSSHTQSMAGSTVSDCSTPVSRSLPNTPSALSARTSAEPQSPELPYARAAMAPQSLTTDAACIANSFLTAARSSLPSIVTPRIHSTHKGASMTVHRVALGQPSLPSPWLTLSMTAPANSATQV